MIRPTCYRCKVELTDFGGLVLSPPFKGDVEDDDAVNKYHLCGMCFDDLYNWMNIKD